MGNLHSISSPPSRYDDFLYAPIYQEANGTSLSVLSALARLNVDAWEQATNLAAMPKADAERTLVSTLDLVSGRSWNPSEAKAIAARLVRLLPQKSEGAKASAAAEISVIHAQRTGYWLLWVSIAIGMSLLSPQRHATEAKSDVSAAKSGSVALLSSSNVNSTPASTPASPIGKTR